MAIDNSTQDGPLSRKCLDVASFITKIIPISALALFCLLTRWISLHLQVIFMRIKEIATKSKNLPCHSASPSLSKHLLFLKEQHFLIYKAVRQINRYFGFYLVIEVVYIFTGVVNASMYILMGVISGEMVLAAYSGVIFLDHLLHLFFITSSTDQINDEV